MKIRIIRTLCVLFILLLHVYTEPVTVRDLFGNTTEGEIETLLELRSFIVQHFSDRLAPEYTIYGYSHTDSLKKVIIEADFQECLSSEKPFYIVNKISSFSSQDVSDQDDDSEDSLLADDGISLNGPFMLHFPAVYHQPQNHQVGEGAVGSVLPANVGQTLMPNVPADFIFDGSSSNSEDFDPLFNQAVQVRMPDGDQFTLDMSDISHFEDFIDELFARGLSGDFQVTFDDQSINEGTDWYELGLDMDSVIQIIYLSS